MLWFSGLRGAIAFSLAIGIKEDLCFKGVASDEHASYLLSTTLLIVLITVLGLGKQIGDALRGHWASQPGVYEKGRFLC